MLACVPEDPAWRVYPGEGMEGGGKNGGSSHHLTLLYVLPHLAQSSA